MTWRQKYTEAIVQVNQLQLQLEQAQATIAAKDKRIAKLEAHHDVHHSQTVGVGVRL